MSDAVGAMWKSEKVSKWMFGLLHVLGLFWLITASLDIVNFNEEDKVNEDGTDTSDWVTTRLMLGLSVALMAGLLSFSGYIVYLAAKNVTGSTAGARFNNFWVQLAK
jgi:hypothetical protein